MRRCRQLPDRRSLIADRDRCRDRWPLAARRPAATRLTGLEPAPSIPCNISGSGTNNDNDNVARDSNGGAPRHGKCRSRTERHGKRRVAQLRRRPRPYAVRAAVADRRKQLRIARDRLAFRHGQSRSRRPSIDFKARRSWSTACSTRPQARGAPSRRSTRRTGEQLWIYSLERRRARRGRAAPALRPRPRVLATTDATSACSM